MDFSLVKKAHNRLIRPACLRPKTLVGSDLIQDPIHNPYSLTFTSLSNRPFCYTLTILCKMKVIAAYLLAVLGGNAAPSADDLRDILGSVGADANDNNISNFLSEVKGKDITELIASGREKLASVPSGGGGAVAVAASPGGGGAAAAPAAESKKEEKEEEKEESDDKTDSKTVRLVSSDFFT
ncbi:60S acidic ribosomal protein P2-4, partial [Mucuna pruriens]